LSYTADLFLEARGGVGYAGQDIADWRFGRGVRPTRLFKLHGPRQSPFCRDESRPDKTLLGHGLHGRARIKPSICASPCLSVALTLTLALYPVHDITIVVHVHEQVLAPLGSRLCIVTKHYAFELHAQCRL